MNQAQLIQTVAEQTNLQQVVVESVLKATGNVITQAVADGEEVALPGLGKLSSKTRNARTGRNPKTGEAVTIPSRRVPVFKASKNLKERIAQ